MNLLPISPLSQYLRSHFQRTFTDGRRKAEAMAVNAANKVLVLCATGKAGKGIVHGLMARGFEVFGTTRSAENGAGLEKLGAKPIVANYVVGADVSAP